MATDSVRWRLDLLVGTAYAILVPVAVLSVGVTGGVRAALALPFALLVPGYAFLAAMYPQRHADADSTTTSSHGFVRDAVYAGIAPGERLLLAVVSSAALTALVALVVNFSPFGIRPAPMFVAVASLTVALFVVAFVRRAGLQSERRSGLPLRSTLSSFGGQFTVHSAALLEADDSRPTSRREVALNVLVVVAVLAMLASAAFAYTAPTDDQQFTEFYVVGENGDGEYTVDAVPSTLAAGDQQTLHPTITNQNGTDHEYSVVVELQRVERTDSGVEVLGRDTRTTLDAEVASGETERLSHQVGPLESGSEYRVVYLLYEGDPPSDPSRENAHRSLSVFLDVTGDGGSS
ncbi:DUF1616 domain-containing protein [Halobacterium bonnevillei]|uniref:DUF1616 domain-containing protein n=1 Tax=Halobacterium bonnevillei TaxID=2692200 RepID=A0A6B0SCV3_9EURY|nr:DUF1616 domain-containing protein [Halobacterium bonnevillei]MXR19575.1 DUF1616 domain-containing protein [Halobacterium bonnevillei]